MQSGNLPPVGGLLQLADDAIRKHYKVNRNYVSYCTNHINYYTTRIAFLQKTNCTDLVNRYEDFLKPTGSLRFALYFRHHGICFGKAVSPQTIWTLVNCSMLKFKYLPLGGKK